MALLVCEEHGGNRQPQAPAAGTTHAEPTELEGWSPAGLRERDTHQALCGMASWSSPAGCLTFVSIGHSFPRDKEWLSLKREDSRRSNRKNSGQRSLLCCSSPVGLWFKKNKTNRQTLLLALSSILQKHNLKNICFYCTVRKIANCIDNYLWMGLRTHDLLWCLHLPREAGTAVSPRHRREDGAIACPWTPCSVFVCELGSWPGGNACLHRGTFTEHWLFTRAVLPPREHLAVSGDILDCHNLQLSRSATSCASKHSPRDKDLAELVKSVEVEESCHRCFCFVALKFNVVCFVVNA